MQRSYNELMKVESDIGIMYEFMPINPIEHNKLILRAINLFGETGLYLLIGKVESAGNDILQTTWFIQSMQQLCRIDPNKTSEFQVELLSHIKRSDLNTSEPAVNLTSDKLMSLLEFTVMPGFDPKNPILLLNRLTIAALEAYIIPFVGMLSESDISRNLIASLTTWLGSTAQTSTGSSGDQSTQDSSPQDATDKIRVKQGSASGTFTKRAKS